MSEVPVLEARGNHAGGTLSKQNECLMAVSLSLPSLDRGRKDF